MIELINVSKKYKIKSGHQVVLDAVNLKIERGQKVGILGQNGAGKSTVIRILSGVESIDSGCINRGMSISWPLAFGGAFQGSLTGQDNLKFICRIYGIDYKKKIDYVRDFSELGRYFNEPVKSYSSGMLSRLSFAISIAVDFDCLLIDEIISVGDARFHAKCKHEIFEKRKDRAFVMVSHEAHNIREHCDSAMVLHQGKLNAFRSVELAYEFYKEVTLTL